MRHNNLKFVNQFLLFTCTFSTFNVTLHKSGITFSFYLQIYKNLHINIKSSKREIKNMKPTIKYISAAAGEGKTHFAVTHLIPALFNNDSNSNVVIASPTKRLLRQIKIDLEKQGFDKQVVLMTSDNLGNFPNTISAVEFCLDNYTGKILLITHASLFLVNDLKLNGWDVFIDEVPDVYRLTKMMSKPNDMTDVIFSNITTTTMVLQPLANNTTYFKAKLNKDSANTYDDTYKMIEERMGGVDNECYVRKTLNSNNDFKYTFLNVLNKSWFSAPKSITIMSANFTDTLIYKFFKNDVKFKQIKLTNPRYVTPRNIDIRYLYENSKDDISGNFIAENAQHMVDVSHYLNQKLSKYNKPIYTKNDDNTSLTINAEFVPPKAQGLNTFVDSNLAICIYSSRPNPYTQQLFEYAGLSSDDILEAQETQTIYQWIMRGNIRVADSTKPYTVVVWHKRQAILLQHILAVTHKVNISKHSKVPAIPSKPRKPSPQVLQGKLPKDEKLQKYIRGIERKLSPSGKGVSFKTYDRYSKLIDQFCPNRVKKAFKLFIS